jgi:hypothetical protein
MGSNRLSVLLATSLALVSCGDSSNNPRTDSGGMVIGQIGLKMSLRLPTRSTRTQAVRCNWPMCVRQSTDQRNPHFALRL